MKIRVGTSILLLLQSRIPTSAFSSPILSSSSSSRNHGVVVIRSNAFFPPYITIRGGSTGTSSTDSGNSNSNSNYVRKATMSPEETAKNIDAANNTDDNDVVKDQITNAAIHAIDITGPSTHTDKFGGMAFVNTSKLNTTNKQQHRVLFVLGGPGAGKGTQSENIVNEYKCIHLSVGDLLRKERLRGADSPQAELIESCLVAGKIVPVEISLGLVRSAMDDACATTTDESSQEKESYGQPIFLVDGFPRNYDNLAGWTNNMPTHASCIGSLVYDCSMEILEKRILGRAETSGRSDDNLESARKRFTTFQTQTMPVVNALEEVEHMQVVSDTTSSSNGMGRLHIQHIAGEGTVEEVWDVTQEAMNGYIKNDILSANALLLKAIESNDSQTYASLTNIEMLSLSHDGDTVGGTSDDKSEGKGKGTTIDIKKAFKSYELIDDCADGIVSHISNAKVEIRTGTKAIVSYDRQIEDKASGKVKSEFRESRVWSHEKKGWVCIHFVRTPLSDE